MPERKKEDVRPYWRGGYRAHQLFPRATSPFTCGAETIRNFGRREAWLRGWRAFEYDVRVAAALRLGA